MDDRVSGADGGTSADGTPQFVEVAAPTDEALQAVLHRIITRLMKLRTRFCKSRCVPGRIHNSACLLTTNESRAFDETRHEHLVDEVLGTTRQKERRRLIGAAV